MLKVFSGKQRDKKLRSKKNIKLDSVDNIISIVVPTVFQRGFFPWGIEEISNPCNCVLYMYINYVGHM